MICFFLFGMKTTEIGIVFIYIWTIWYVIFGMKTTEIDVDLIFDKDPIIYDIWHGTNMLTSI